jgi:ubiquinone/menaquinone biosynthesis C-methylase UbiE
MIRLFAYHRIQWTVSESPLPSDVKYDKVYEESLYASSEILADYEQMNIDAFKEGYSTCLLRKYLWSNSNDFILDFSEIKDEHHILDAGCGIGVQAIHFCKKLPHLKVSCIVNSQLCYHKARENVKKANLSHRIYLYCMDFDKLEEPILSQRFDRILMNQSIGYSTDRKMLLHNLHNLLRPEGKLFICTLTINTSKEGEEDQMIDQTIREWKYNFSTLGCILYDLKDYPVKYITLNPEHTTWVFINPTDLYYLYEFNRLNHDLFDIRFFLTPNLHIQFLIVG